MEPTFELTAAERELLEELAWMLAHAIEQGCPRLSVDAIDFEISELVAAAAGTLSAA